MTDSLDPGALDSEDLDGHSIDELSDYLDSGRSPRNPDIENSPGCQIALAALTRLRATTWAMLEAEAESDPERDNVWITRVLDNIKREARAGRDIPISHPDPTVELTVTEGSVRGLIRAAGDGTGGAIIGKCVLDGDVTVPGEPIEVNVTASVAWGENLQAIAALMRARILDDLRLHTELNILSVNVMIQDIHTRHSATTKDVQ
ncbi:hypothetical protein [Glaciihabitans sp. UYNi722]|uniref:hypothetical protein n=1 Tax=Glaciihabitans sp. UYNi722 TaxID=3156344 RepID=UPI0033985C88